MLCVSAAGSVGLSLRVFKGTQFPCRDMSIAGHRVVQIPSYFLPYNAIVNMREDVAGFDSTSFY